MTLLDNLQVNPLCLAPLGDRFAGTVSSDVTFLQAGQRIVFIIGFGAGAVGTTTITVEECDDDTPTNTTAIAYRYQEVLAAGVADQPSTWKTAAAAGITPAAGANKAILIEVHASELAAGFPGVRTTFVESVDGATDGYVATILGDLRYPGNAPDRPSALTEIT